MERLPVLAAVLAASLVLGLVDALLLVIRPGAEPPGLHTLGLTAFYLSALTGLAGVVITAALALPLYLVPRRLLSRLPDAAFASVGVLLASATAYVLVKPLNWAAIDIRLHVLGSVVLGGWLLVRRWYEIPRWRRFPPARTLLGLSLAWVAGAGWVVLEHPKIPVEVQAALIEQTVAGPRLAGVVRGWWDHDHDGYPTVLCGRDCDCDDSDPGRNPGAYDEPEDGVDQDCDGQDAPKPPPTLIPKGVTDVVTSAAPPPPEPEERPTPGPRPNIILISVDTLRADHMSCYGYHRETTPRLDRWASTGTLFEQARAQGGMTRFSVPSFITGRYHTELVRTGGKWPRIGSEDPTVGERLTRAGYETGVVSCIFYFMRRYGITRGFQRLDLTPARRRSPFHRHVTGDLVTERGIRMLDELAQTGKPFFLWLHYGDPHSDYLQHPDGPRWGKTWLDLYDGEIYYTDVQVHRFLKHLEDEGLAGSTVVFLTADHGEGLVRSMDHGRLFHGQHLYDNLVKVPLIVVGPGVVARRVETPVGLIDMVPTMLELARAPGREDLPGVSLVPWFEGKSPPRPPVFGEKPKGQEPPKKYMVSWPYKLIWDMGLNRFQLYDLRVDPNETNDLLGRDPGLDAALIARLKAWRANELRFRPVRASVQ